MAATLSRGSKVGPIEPHVLYPLREMEARTGLGRAAFRTARRAGLVVKYAGGRAYVLGADFIRYVEDHGKNEK
jgi:hypothetical protein